MGAYAYEYSNEQDKDVDNVDDVDDEVSTSNVYKLFAVVKVPVLVLVFEGVLGLKVVVMVMGV
jgi:hypothetical protein